MNNSIQKNHLLVASIFLIINLLLNSCIYPKYSLSVDEQNYTLKSGYSIAYDVKSIRRFKDNGIYSITIESMSTLYDTNKIKSSAIKIAKEVSPIMNFKDHHQYIDVIFQNKHIGKRYKPYYKFFYQVRIPISNLEQTILKNIYFAYVLPDGGIAPLYDNKRDYQDIYHPNDTKHGYQDVKL